MEKYEINIIDSHLDELSKDSDYLQTILDNVVNSYTEALDDIMKDIHDNIIVVDDPDDSVIEKYFLTLSNCLYFIGERLEKLGLYEDISEATYKEVYNKSYLDNRYKETSGKGGKYTVAELTALAEEDTKYETAINILYGKAYKIVKYKIEAANTMISTLSKILSKRMQDSQLSQQTERRSSNGMRVLNEGV